MFSNSQDNFHYFSQFFKAILMNFLTRNLRNVQEIRLKNYEPLISKCAKAIKEIETLCDIISESPHHFHPQLLA